MRKVFFGMVALVASTTFAPLAIAADMTAPYSKAPALVAPEPTWTGWYVGVNGGYMGSNVNAGVNLTGTDTGIGGLGSALKQGAIPGNFNGEYDGYLLGGTVGYNWQVNPFVVVGLEAFFDGGKATGGFDTAIAPPTFAPTQTVGRREIDNLGTLRGRFGLTIVGPLFFYATGGLAVAEHKLGIGASGPYAPPLNAFNLTSSTAVGWTVGGGMEYMWGPHWSFKAEWLWVDLGSISSTIPYTYGANASSLTASTRDHMDVLLVGVNYRF